MRVKYFSDTDTALVEFTDHEVEKQKRSAKTYTLTSTGKETW